MVKPEKMFTPKEGLRERSSPICTLSQNGYGIWLLQPAIFFWFPWLQMLNKEGGVQSMKTLT